MADEQADLQAETTEETPGTAKAGPNTDTPLTGKPAAPKAGGGSEVDIDFLLDIPLTVRVEIGRTRMLINELLQLGQGSVIELQKLVGEPFEVLVNDKLVARGEIVVVNERFGVRLTDIITPMERIEQLG